MLPFPPTRGTLAMAAAILAARGGDIPCTQAWLHDLADTLEDRAILHSAVGDMTTGDRQANLAHIARVAAMWIPSFN